MQGTQSLWWDERAKPAGGDRPALNGDLESEVVVIGAGVAGLTAALELSRNGKKVVVLEAHRVGAGESQRTTSHLTEVLDQRFFEMADSFGDEVAVLMAQGQRMAIDFIERQVSDLNIDCGFSRLDGYLFAAAGNQEQREELEEEARACERLKLGGHRVSSVEGIAMSTGGALRFERQAQLIPGPYLQALARQVEAEGGRIFEQTMVKSVDDSDRCEVVADRGIVVADHVIVATNAPMHTKLMLHVSIENYRSYVVASAWPEDRPLPLLSDLAEPYHYIRTQSIDGGTYLIVGGEDHAVGEGPGDETPYERLREYTAANFGGGPLTHRWSGQIVDTADGLPYIGPTRRGSRILVATGFSGNGYTNGTLAGITLKEAVLGREDPWIATLSPMRVPNLASVHDVVTHNLSVAKHFIGDRLVHGAPLSSIPNGCGQILQVRGERVAVYRDDEGALHGLSPVCTHMGCYVQWNGAERSWDCPCHGSRFGAQGDVINGPAVKNLEPRALHEDAESESEARARRSRGRG